MAATDRGREAQRATKRGGRPVPTASSEHYELTWPYFMYTIVLCFFLTTIGLWLWSMLIAAPLEPLADPNKTPNPSKAPWYFVGLQELLVYFDPWIAGVVLPTLIIVGLMAVPYLDKNPHGIGEYNYKDRKFAVLVLVGDGVLVYPDHCRLFLPWSELAMVLAVGELGISQGIARCHP
jgi:quinol-cytochrome oxidoreductase complex cytochrome b subunit